MSNQLIEVGIYASVHYDIIGSDNGLSFEQRQNIIWTNLDIASAELSEIYFDEISTEN